MNFTAFVLLTLVIELAASALFSQYATGTFATIGFYAAMTTWSIWRANHVVDHYRLSSGPALFCVLMLSMAACAAWMVLITLLTALSIRYGYTPAMLASTYNLSYTLYAYAAMAATLLELLTIFTDRMLGCNSAMGDRAVSILGLVYRRQSLACHQTIEAKA